MTIANYQRNAIIALNDGERVVVTSDYGKAVIRKVYNVFILFYVPKETGTPVFREALEEERTTRLFEEIESWK